MAKAAYFYAQAATQGNVESRYNLGYFEWGRGNCNLAVRQFLISVKMGEESSLVAIKMAFMREAFRGPKGTPICPGGNEES